MHFAEVATTADPHHRSVIDTDYLVTAFPDTFSARRAASSGITVISEQQMMAYIEQGAFPEHRPPSRPYRKVEE